MLFSTGLLDGLCHQLSTLADPLVTLRPSIVTSNYSFLVPTLDLILKDFSKWMKKTKLAKCKK